MEFPVLVNWTSPFLFQGLLGGIFHFYSNFYSTACKQKCGDSDQTLHSGASDLFLPMSHTKGRWA